MEEQGPSLGSEAAMIAGHIVRTIQWLDDHPGRRAGRSSARRLGSRAGARAVSATGDVAALCRHGCCVREVLRA